MDMCIFINCLIVQLVLMLYGLLTVVLVHILGRILTVQLAPKHSETFNGIWFVVLSFDKLNCKKKKSLLTVINHLVKIVSCPSPSRRRIQVTTR